MNYDKLAKGDIVWVDTSAFIASPEKTGRTILCEVLVDSGHTQSDVYVCPSHTAHSPKTIHKSQLGVPNGFKLIRRKGEQR